jgi:hypothetical protein
LRQQDCPWQQSPGQQFAAARDGAAAIANTKAKLRIADIIFFIANISLKTLVKRE